MADPKIVDAVPEAPAANMTQQSVPVKIDGSALAEMMSKIAAAKQQPATEHINPAEYVLAAGARMQSMYARYEKLRKLGSLLHGKSANEPLPHNLQIESVTIRFRAENGAQTEAEIFNVACVGDLAQLLVTEMGVIILALQQETKALTKLSQATEDTTQKARDAWETSNKDRKIVIAEATQPDDNAPATNTDAGEAVSTNEN